MNLAERSINSAAWNIGTSAIRVVILLVRSIVLARLLPVDTFGVYALAYAVISFASMFARLGTNGALVHRSPETEDLDRATAVHQTLRLVTSSIVLALLVGGAVLFTDGELRFALIMMSAIYSLSFMTDTPRILLGRRVTHKRQAIMGLLEDIIGSAIAVFLAWQGFTLIALIATDIVMLLIQIVGFYVWRPFWHPRLLWDTAIVRYMLRWGSKSLGTELLGIGSENIDELYIGSVMGATSLGFYSRAFTFATYPRRILAAPIVSVAGGTYAELKYQRTALSRSFFRTNALLIRVGFAMAGLLVLLAPQLITIMLGETWLPMVATFQLMLVFVMLDPIRLSTSGVFGAVGRLDQLLKIQLIQFVVLAISMLILGSIWDIEGVALAVDIMLLVSMTVKLRMAREHVDFSARRLFIPPLLALLGGTAMVLLVGRWLCLLPELAPVCTSDWGILISHSLLFCLGYGLVLLVLERDDLLAASRQILGILLPARWKPKQSAVADPSEVEQDA